MSAGARKSDAQAPSDGEMPSMPVIGRSLSEVVAPDYKKYKELKPEQRI